MKRTERTELDRRLNEIMEQVNQGSHDRLRKMGVVTLGQLHDTLESVAPSIPVKMDASFGNFAPSHLYSYRGYYRYPAFDYHTGYSAAGEILRQVNEALLGQVYEGYKGGDFIMHSGSFVFIAQYGVASGIALMDVKVHSDVVVFHGEQVHDSV